MHGGIGVTWEHDIHLYLRRVTLNSGVLGTVRNHRHRLAAGGWPGLSTKRSDLRGSRRHPLLRSSRSSAPTLRPLAEGRTCPCGRSSAAPPTGAGPRSALRGSEPDAVGRRLRRDLLPDRRRGQGPEPLPPPGVPRGVARLRDADLHRHPRPVHQRPAGARVRHGAPARAHHQGADRRGALGAVHVRALAAAPTWPAP